MRKCYPVQENSPNALKSYLKKSRITKYKFLKYKKIKSKCRCHSFIYSLCPSFNKHLIALNVFALLGADDNNG